MFKQKQKVLLLPSPVIITNLLVLCYFEEMIFVLTLASLVALSWGLPRDVVIQFERSVLINGTVVERILVNGASDTYLKGQIGNHPVVRSIRDEALMMIVKREHATANNGTYIRLRECKLRGYEVWRLSDRFQLNGRDYLVLDIETDSWTVLLPEASDLKKTWALLASLEKIHLKEDCEEFIRQINDNQKQEERGVLRVITPVFSTFLFIGFVFTSILIFKRQSQHPGGVIGSIIHYPAHHLEVPLQSRFNTGTETNQKVPPVLKGLF